MSSSSPARFFRDSPPGDGGYGGGDGTRSRARSRFTYRHLAQLAAYNTACPLRVVAHIDLDAFYAQCEMVRLGVGEDKPLAVQQWQGLIAVNYPARKFGIGRHCTVDEAKKLCPDLIAQHVATWREGHDTWAYRPDAAANIATDKVSLDPYRLESRKIFAVVKACLPPGQCKVEKAGIDEMFIDLSANVHSLLLERHPGLSSVPPAAVADPDAHLPLPSVSALDWQADELAGPDEGQAEEEDGPDWDDVALAAASGLVRLIRGHVRAELGYTCSAGVSANKMLSKLASAHRKPDAQTVVRSRARARARFLAPLRLSRIRMLGGRLGEEVAEAMGTDEVSALVALPSLPQLLGARLGEATARWVHDVLRGVDRSGVRDRTRIRSMLSAKSFRPAVTGEGQAAGWLRIFAADVWARLVGEGVPEGRRGRPRTLTLHHRLATRSGGADAAASSCSRSCPIPRGGRLDEGVLFELALGLLRALGAEEAPVAAGDHAGGAVVGMGQAGPGPGPGQQRRSRRVYPCANLSLNVSGFEDGATGNMGIGGFLVKGEGALLHQQQRVAAVDAQSDGTLGQELGIGHQQGQAQAQVQVQAQAAGAGGSRSIGVSSNKRRRVNNTGGGSGGIQRFFTKMDMPRGMVGQQQQQQRQYGIPASAPPGVETPFGAEISEEGDGEEDMQPGSTSPATTTTTTTKEDHHTNRALAAENPPMVSSSRSPLSLAHHHHYQIHSRHHGAAAVRGRKEDSDRNEGVGEQDDDEQEEHDGRVYPAMVTTGSGGEAFTCPRCGVEIGGPEAALAGAAEEDEVAVREHMDWHLAVDLQEEEDGRGRGERGFAAGTAGGRVGRPQVGSPPVSVSRGEGGKGGGGGHGGRGRTSSSSSRRSKARVEPGQSRLKFG